MPKINQRTYVGAPALVPPLRSNPKSCGDVEALFAYADRLEARYTRRPYPVERLTPRTARQSFRANWMPPRPERRTSSVLLERIRALRAEQPMEKRGRKLPVARVPRPPGESHHDQEPP